MAKINLTTQHNQENLTTLASWGILIGLVVTLVGIKLWWFKQRLSFEQKSSASSSRAHESPTPAAVLVSRRSKQPKYKKDKRYSQQIYESVQVHGVFRQKHEDEFEIQRPAHLPPVRIRQTSEGNSFQIRPPPRNKRRDQVHSTAFEDLEIATPLPLATASSSDLSVIPEINTKITLTFEEFERQFNLKEIKRELAEPKSHINNEISEIPKPPLRLNRSSSTAVKTEKPEHILKLSQSITAPEFHRVTEKRSVVVHSSAKEDLTKIDFYEESKIYENLAHPKVKSAGYIKYEEVDNDLHEKELNTEADKQDYNIIDSGFYESSKTAKPVRNERPVYNNEDENESPSADSTNKFSFDRTPYKTYELEAIDFHKHNFANKSTATNKFDLKYSIHYENSACRSENTENPNEFLKDSADSDISHVTESKIVQAEATSENRGNYFVNKQQSKEFIKDNHKEKENQLTKLESFGYNLRTEAQNTGNLSHAGENETISELNTQNETQVKAKYVLKNRPVEDKISPVFNQNSFTKTDVQECSISFEEDFDSQFESWPQFEEKIETPQVTIRRFNSHTLQAQDSFNENDDFAKASSSYSYINKHGSNVKPEISPNDRRPTGYGKCRPESPEFQDIGDWQEAFNNKFYTQVRSFIIAEESLTSFEGREVSFDSSVLQQVENNSNERSEIQKRRPTGYTKSSDYEESDENTNNNVTTLDTQAFQKPKVKFEDDGSGSEHQTEIYTLNQRRPTGFVRLAKKDELEGMFEGQVKFDETTVFKDAEEIGNSIIKQRRPTGFIKKSELLDLSDNETTKEDSIKDLKNEEISQNVDAVRFIEAERNLEKTPNSLVKERRPTGYVMQVISPDCDTSRFLEAEKHFQDSVARQQHSPASPTVRFLETETNFEDYETNTESLVKQRRPTGYVRQEELLALEKQVSFDLTNDNNETSSQQNEALQQRRPTGFITKEEITKQVNFQLEENPKEDEKSTGFVSNRELKCLDQPAPIYRPSNDDNSNKDFDDHLWQELEKDVAQDISQNFEEEFAKIRQSYEINEADFLELKDEVQKMPTNMTQQPLGFGKTIEDDWENFQKLKSQVIIIPSPTPEEKIKITFSDNDLANTTSILKDSKLEEDVTSKPRKSKVTFDCKTEEHVIPARKSHNYTGEDTDFDDEDEYNMAPPIPPQPLKRSSNINYNDETKLTPIVTIPSSITLFGSQISTKDQEVEDSWSAIRKHRNMTNNLQNYFTGSDNSLQEISSKMPPKSAYRNPMAQLAIQRAKEVRSDMDGFKSRSISDRKSEASGRQKQKLFNLSNADHEEGTEA